MACYEFLIFFLFYHPFPARNISLTHALLSCQQFAKKSLSILHCTVYCKSLNLVELSSKKPTHFTWKKLWIPPIILFLIKSMIDSPNMVLDSRFLRQNSQNGTRSTRPWDRFGFPITLQEKAECSSCRSALTLELKNYSVINVHNKQSEFNSFINIDYSKP